MAVRVKAPAGAAVSPEVLTAVFHTALVSDRAMVVAEVVDRDRTVVWSNDQAADLLGYATEDLSAMPVEQLLPSLRGGELKLLLRRERAVEMSLPVRCASGVRVQCLVHATPDEAGRLWTLRISAPEDG